MGRGRGGERPPAATWRLRCACGHPWLLHESDDLPDEVLCTASSCRRGRGTTASMCELPPAGWVLP